MQNKELKELWKACEDGSLEIIQDYLPNNIILNDLFIWSCVNNQIHIVQYLVNKQILNNQGLYWACVQGNLSLVTYLVKQGCMIPFEKEDSFICRNEHISIFLYLLHSQLIDKRVDRECIEYPEEYKCLIELMVMFYYRIFSINDYHITDDKLFDPNVILIICYLSF